MIRTTLISCFNACLLVLTLGHAGAALSADVDGHVWHNSTPLCALVLANGKSVFSCNPNGPFELLDVPLDSNGQIDVQIFAAGFAPFRQKVTPTGVNPMASISQAQMARVSNGREFQISADYQPSSIPGLVRVSGTVRSGSTPICALILANGEKEFTCNQNLGVFSLDVPLDADGKVTLMAFAAGFQPFRESTEVEILVPPPGGECINLAGTWRITESLSLTCRLGGESESLEEGGTGVLNLQQNGCDIAVEDPTLGVPRTGTIVGNRVTLAGDLVVPRPEVRVTENRLVLEQTVTNANEFTLVGVGVLTGTLGGSSVRCDADVTSRFVRQP